MVTSYNWVSSYCGLALDSGINALHNLVPLLSQPESSRAPWERLDRRSSPNKWKCYFQNRLLQSRRAFIDPKALLVPKSESWASFKSSFGEQKSSPPSPHREGGQYRTNADKPDINRTLSADRVLSCLRDLVFLSYLCHLARCWQRCC